MNDFVQTKNVCDLHYRSKDWGLIYMIKNTVKQSYCKILLQFKITVFYLNMF